MTPGDKPKWPDDILTACGVRSDQELEERIAKADAELADPDRLFQRLEREEHERAARAAEAFTRGRAEDLKEHVELRMAHAEALKSARKAGRGRARGAAAARAAPALGEHRREQEQKKAKRYSEAVGWQREHPNGKPHQLAKKLGVSRRTLRRILRGK